MAVRRPIPTVTPPEWTPDRSMRAIQVQLTELRSFRELPFQTRQSTEDAWQQKTESVLRRAFSSDSTILEHFYRASHAGSYNIMGNSSAQMLMNLAARVSAYETALNTAIADLKMSLPEEDVRGVYETGEQYEFCKDLRTLIQSANTEILVVDPYLDPEIFDVYVDSLPSSVRICILTDALKPNVTILAQKFATGRSNFQMKTTINLHDRMLFVDSRCWVIGQSIKDAAKKKPTYIVEHSNDLMRKLYQPIWDSATSVVRS